MVEFNTNQFREVTRQRHAAGETLHADEVAQLPPTHYSALLDEAASVQRGRPESAMLTAQRRMGGGVYPHVLEHVGDLTHRIAEGGGVYGTEFVTPKVRRSLHSIDHPYGFEREMHEQIADNQRFRASRGEEGVDVEEVGRLGRAYADEHRKVPAYTEPMMHGRQAAVALGEQDYPTASAHLNALQRSVDKGPEHWKSQMSQTASVRFLRGGQ